MHGVRRGSRPTGAALEAEEARLRRDAAQLRAALAARRTPGPESAKLIESAAETHPDEYSLWAFLREKLLRTSDDELLPEWESALSLTARALRRHHKAYPAWQQRLWLLGDPQLAERLPKEAHETRLAEERALSEAMLARDGRNFHAWAHRMRLRTATATPDEEALPKELEFVTSKINVDFANYSAWHQRSAILPRMRKHGAPAPPEQVKEELDFVRQAFYTEPDVQSTWFYHRWLLAGMPARGIKAVVDRALWESELLACEELLEIEPDARWALHTKAHILAHLGKKDEAVKILQRLQEIVRQSELPSFHSLSYSIALRLLPFAFRNCF